MDKAHEFNKKWKGIDMNFDTNHRLSKALIAAVTKILCGILCIQALTGCTTTLSSVSMPSATEAPPSGLVYKLPAKRFSLRASYELTGCDDNDPENPIISAIVTPTLTSAIEGDDTAMFVLDYEGLKAATKVQRLAVTLNKNGLLSGLNSDNQDKTAEVITNIASSIFAAGRAVALSPLARAKRVASPCKYITTRLTEKQKLESSLPTEKQNDQQRDQISSDIAELKVSIATLRGDIKFYKDAGTQTTKTLLAEAIKSLNEAEEKLKLLTTQLSDLGSSNTENIKTKILKIRTQLTFTSTKSFVPRIGSTNLDVVLDSSAKQTLFDDPDATCDKCPKVSLQVLPQQTGNSSNTYKPAKGFGIAYRIPAMVTAKVLVTQPDRQYEALQLDTPVPQLGSIASLNLENKPFEDTNLTIAFDENGGLTKLDFSSTAQALQASAAAKSTMQGYLDFVQQRQTDRITATKQNLDLQKAQADTAATIAADSNAIEKGTADTANTIASDRVQTLKSLLDLQTLQSGQASTDVQTISNLQLQNQLLDLQIENAKKQLQLKNIQSGGTTP